MKLIINVLACTASEAVQYVNADLIEFNRPYDIVDCIVASCMLNYKGVLLKEYRIHVSFSETVKSFPDVSAESCS